MRYVYYSFHYARDIKRVFQVRNSGLTQDIDPANQIIDHADFEKIKRDGDRAVRAWIEAQMNGAGVTAVLIGAETYKRRWVLYEIQRSQELGKGIVGIRIHGLKDWNVQTDIPGQNPLDLVPYPETIGKFVTNRPLSAKFRTYDWVLDDGYNNLPDWVEEAAKIASR